MSKILINENNTLKVCELPAFMTLGETTKIKDVPGLKELLSIPCSEGEYQLVDDTVIFYKDGDKHFIYNMRTGNIQITNLDKGISLPEIVKRNHHHHGKNSKKFQIRFPTFIFSHITHLSCLHEASSESYSVWLRNLSGSFSQPYPE